MNLTEKGKLREMLKEIQKIESLSSNLEIRILCQSARTKITLLLSEM